MASLDKLALETTTRRDGDTWVLDGVKPGSPTAPLPTSSSCGPRYPGRQVKVFVVETPADDHEASVITGEVSLQWRVPAGEGVTELHPGLA